MKTTYNKNSEKAQDIINRVIFDHKVKEIDIARALGKKPQTISYQLHEAINMDREIEQGIYIYFRMLGIMVNQPDECELINDHFLDFTSIITQQISILSGLIRKAVSDNSITDDERNRLKTQIKFLRMEVSGKIDQLESILTGHLENGKT